MSATSQESSEDPRVARSRAAALSAARTLFLQVGYARATMEDIATLAGLSKRTLYNIFGDKSSLFREIVAEVITFAERFASGLSGEMEGITAPTLSGALHDLGHRLARGILRPDVIALRRLLIRESGEFPELSRDYFDRAPGRVMAALSSGFEALARAGLLRAAEPGRAAGQFAYLVVGAPLDRAMLLGVAPGEEEIRACARSGVETFLIAFGPDALTGTGSNRDVR